jgi:hypothetical protein
MTRLRPLRDVLGRGARRLTYISIAAGLGALCLVLDRWVVLAAVGGIVVSHLLVPMAALPLALAPPLLALLGFDWAWVAIGLDRPDPATGLWIAGAVILVACYFTAGYGGAPSRPIRLTFAVLVTLLTVVVPPLAYDHFAAKEPPATLGPAISELDLVVVGSRHVDVPPPTNPHGWNIRTWTGVATADGVEWDGEAPTLRPTADPVLLLAVDGLPANFTAAGALPDLPAIPAEAPQWQRLARAALPRRVPTFALLQSTDEARLAPFARVFDGARSVQSLAGDRTVGDVALRLEVTAPGADEDLALAYQHRPALFFDGGERFRTPLNIDAMLATGAVDLCDDRQPLVARCTTVHSSQDLYNGDTHLSFDTEEVARKTQQTAIYVHVADDLQTPGLKDLDYWWYLPDNPANAASGAMCGAGLVIPEITCFDHQSDWEGVTVVVRPGNPTPVAVHYAAHKHVVRYPWSILEPAWRGPRFARAREGIDITRRPLVFVARGTHAAYPNLCRAASCDEPGAFNENRHDGGRPWPGNRDAVCASLCVDVLPTHERGASPAQWNGFDGYWGTPRCVAVAFCSSSKAPKSPGLQGRYNHPWCWTARAPRFGALTLKAAPRCLEPAKRDARSTGSTTSS